MFFTFPFHRHTHHCFAYDHFAINICFNWNQYVLFFLTVIIIILMSITKDCSNLVLVAIWGLRY